MPPMRTLPLMLGGILACLTLSGCSSAPVIRTVPVEVERFSYLPIPEGLLVDCPASVGGVDTNGRLLDALIETERARQECESRLKAIRELKPPE